MSGKLTTPKYEYVVVTKDATNHLVMVVHDDTPGWYRLVAAFPNKVRADDYADMENQMAADFWDEKPLVGREEDSSAAPPSLPSEPKSSIIPGELVRRSTVLQQTRIEQHDVIERPQAVLQSRPDMGTLTRLSEPIQEPAPAKPEAKAPVLAPTEKVEVPVENSDIDKLKPVTEKQSKIFAAICDLSKGGSVALSADIAKLAGYAGIQDSLGTLERHGYIAKSKTRAGAWVPLVKGAAKIDPALVPPRWTEKQLEGLKEVCRAGGDMFAYSEKIGRTLYATQQQARHSGWFDTWYSKQKEAASASAKSAPPVPLPQEKPESLPPAPEMIGADEEVTLEDLSARTQDVLLALSSLKTNDTPESVFAQACGMAASEVPFHTNRLLDLGCATEDGANVVRLTVLGLNLATQIRTQAASAISSRVTNPYLSPAKVSSPKPIIADTKDHPRDNNGGAKAERVSTTDKFDIAVYLEKKGRVVTRTNTGFIINGVTQTFSDALSQVNMLRRSAELPPLAHGDAV